MDPTILTPRLKLTLITTAERGSPELEWYHQLRSDEKATYFSIFGRSKTLEDTEKLLKGEVTTNADSDYRAAYAVHKLVPSTQGETPASSESKAEFIGWVSLKSIPPGQDAKTGLGTLPEHLVIPDAAAATTLTVEVGYAFLPKAWGCGYAPEAVKAVFEACKKGVSFWRPYEKLYVRAIVNEENPPSMRVLDKSGMVKKGVYHWKGKPIFIAGRTTEESYLHIFGLHLLE
ncbi:GNAT domain-containing protein [Podospora didyma]|uniref:GNAT domain-containing protein n=1 Tax=Podospora didyma TaxID=330526 RepID=A0AAE0K1P2_9PEZI|nr:GNAT domain-containing protein [Podospora didyma]